MAVRAYAAGRCLRAPQVQGLSVFALSVRIILHPSSQGFGSAICMHGRQHNVLRPEFPRGPQVPLMGSSPAGWIVRAFEQLGSSFPELNSLLFPRKSPCSFV